MSEWSDSSISFEGNVFFLVLLPLFVVFVYWVYRRTYPEVRSLQRMVLVILRSVALTLLVAVLAEPVLAWWSKQVIRPILLVLVDTSLSMKTAERGNTRLGEAVAVLDAAKWRSHLEQAEIRAWGFAESIYPLDLDTVAALNVGGQATNIGRALAASLESTGERERVLGFVVFSDGAHNLGRDPVQLADDLGVPVYALGVGGEEMPADIQLTEVRTVEIGYVGQRQQIDAELRSWGYEGRSIEVLLYEGERELERQSVVLDGRGLVQRISFDLTPQEAGPRIFRVVATPGGGEFTRADNEVMVFTRILEERTRVLVLAGGPSPDLAFLHRSFVADSNIVVETLIQREIDSFYGGDWAESVLQNRDVVFVVDPGSWLFSGLPAQTLVRYVDSGTGLAFIGGVKSARDWREDSSLAELMPFREVSSFVDGEILLQISTAGRHHPLVRLQADEVDPWARLPPLPGYFRTAQLREGAMVLVESAGRAPVIATGIYGQGKVMAALAAAFWRLDLMSSGVDGQPKTIRQFWRNAAKWLALGAPSGRIRVSTERHVYRAGEEVAFAAQVFDELLRPQRGAMVKIELSGREAFEVQEQGAGHYRSVYSGLEPGEYEYRAKAYIDEVEVGVDEGRFIVEEHSIEFSDLRANQLLLGELARVSGGFFHPLSGWEDGLQKLIPRKRLVEESRAVSLWGPLWPALLALALLAAEWFLRKRSGMI